MNTNDQALWQLHVRFASGEALNAEERAQLDAWYEAQDHAESTDFVTVDQKSDIDILQTQVDKLLLDVITATDNIRRLNAENAELRREITELRQKVAHQAALELA